MSGANKNCHVSTKWEDTGGQPNPECDATVLLNPATTNDISLQELIDKELALRGTAATTNGIDRPKSLLICDIDDQPVDAVKKSDPFASLEGSPIIENGGGGMPCQRTNSIRSNKSLVVTEVDDFDQLYNEVSSGEIVTNGHALTPLLSPEPSALSPMLSPELSVASQPPDSDTRDAEPRASDSGAATPVLLELDANSLPHQKDAKAEPQADSPVQNTGPTVDDYPNKDIPSHLQDDGVLCNGGTMYFGNSCIDGVHTASVSKDFVSVHAADVVANREEVCDADATVRNSVPLEPLVVNALESGWVSVSDATVSTQPQQSEAAETEQPVEDVTASGAVAPSGLREAGDGQTENEDVAGDEPTAIESGSIAFEERTPVGAEDDGGVDVDVVPVECVNELACEANGGGDGVDGDAFTIGCRGNAMDARDVLVLDKNGNDEDYGYPGANANEKFENGFENWTTQTTATVVTATEKSPATLYDEREPPLTEACSYNLTASTDVVSESTAAEKKTVKKKKSTSEESVTTTKTKKTKKTKKCEEKENISVRSGFGKFDQLTKKTVMHVRSSDPAKAQQQFSQNDASQDSGNLCKACNKNVFAMEQIKAERHVWHKNCFRCKTCNKQLTVDVYSSHEGELFCKPHFRDLFKPKTVVEEEKPLKFRKPELIIRENEPMELPPDVVRASDKPDLGLEELSSLNVKSRFQVFEKPQVECNADKSPVCVKRSPSILSKLAKFQAKGMDVGVSSDIFNGIDYEESSSSEEEPAPNDNVTRSTVVKEKPIAFNKMNDVKMNWENGQTALKEERREQRREEMQNIRSRLFMGKQNKMREAYENAVAESERGNVKKDVDVKSEKARTIKEKFEKGEVIRNEESDEEQEKKSSSKNEDMDVFEAGISKKSRSIFQQMDAAVVKTQSNSNVASPPHIVQNGHKSHREVINRQSSSDVVRASDPVEEVAVQTADISSKFKFFETYKPPDVKRKAFRITPPREGQQKAESPEREVQKNPDVVRNDEQINDENEVLKKSNTTAKMLSLFRQLEETRETVPDGPKPMKKFTPPPASSSSSEAESEEESEEPSEASNPGDDIVRASYKNEDEYLKLAQSAAKAKALKAKFEKWEPEKQSSNNAINLLDSEQASLDTTKSLRARFESLKAEQPTDKPRPKVNRFVDKSLPGYCDTCFKKVYPLEKVEAGDKVFHRSCFKCTRCSGILRMETFTMNNGHLYCVPHFKQLFITKGNYDEGFGNHQHKAKWPVHTSVPMTNGLH